MFRQASIAPPPVAPMAAHWLQLSAQRLQEAGVETPALDARILLLHVLGITAEAWVAGPERILTPQELEAYQALITRRAGREPVSQLTGRREFWGLNLAVTAATLDPRPDSETLIEAALAQIADRQAAHSILDLGTGTGCLLLSLLHELPNAKGTGVDKSADALKVARHNAERLHLQKRVEFLHQDWNIHTGSGYNIIISNPPYIPTEGIDRLAPEVARFEPKLALDGGADGLDCYRSIFSRLPNLLVAGGMAMFELGAGQLQDAAKLADRYGFRVEAVHHDMQGIARCITIKNKDQ